MAPKADGRGVVRTFHERDNEDVNFTFFRVGTGETRWTDGGREGTYERGFTFSRRGRTLAMSSPLTNICLWRRRRRGVVSQSNFHPRRSPTHARVRVPCPHSHSLAPPVQQVPHGDDALHRSIVRSLSRSERSVQSHRCQSVTHPGSPLSVG